MRKRAHAMAGQLALPLMGNAPSSLTAPATRLAEVAAPMSRVALDNLPTSALIIPVESTFDTCQGIREAKIALQAHDVVVFDARHLELAERSVGGASDPFATYVTDRGGNYMSLAPFLNVLRCSASLSRWRIKEQLPPLTFAHIPPREGTKARDLWEALGMDQLFEQMRAPRTLGALPVRAFESRYVSPILVVTKANRQPVLASIHGWIDHIAPASGTLRNHLIWAIPEIVTNLVKHGLGGLRVLSIWPAGQVEILWSNRIDHLPQWPPRIRPRAWPTHCCTTTAAGMACTIYSINSFPPTGGCSQSTTRPIASFSTPVAGATSTGKVAEAMPSCPIPFFSPCNCSAPMCAPGA